MSNEIEDILNAHTHTGFVIKSFINDARYVLITQHHGKIMVKSPYFLKRFPSLKHSFLVEYDHAMHNQLLDPINLSLAIACHYPFLNHLINTICAQCIYPGGCTRTIYEILHILENTQFEHIEVIKGLFSDFIKHIFMHDKYVVDLAPHQEIDKKTLLIIANNHSREFKNKIKDLIDYAFDKELAI